MKLDEPDASDETERTRYAEALSDATRRRTLRVLQEAGAALSLTELAVELAEGTGPVDPESDRVRRRKIQLYHRHLPKLSAAGLVEYDPERRTAALADGVNRADVRENLLAA